IRHGTDKWGQHFYTPIYHTLFSHLRDKPVRLLEIGVGGYGFESVGGASLAMWASYFLAGTIVGIDIAQKTLDLGPRVHLRQGSQNDAIFLQQVSKEFGPFDIVIDDGSHMPDDVVASFEALFPLLAPEGFYVIEDIQTSYWPQVSGAGVDGGKVLQRARQVMDNLNHAEIGLVVPDFKAPATAKSIRALHAFHNILVFEKGDNSQPSNFAYTLSNPRAAQAVRVIQQELAKAPTPAGYASLIDLYKMAREFELARQTIDRALQLWPNDPHVLVAALGVADTGNDDKGFVTYARQILALEPSNAALKDALDGRLA
ncbi:class I SAM-dependent methyltransferase, partial [Rhodoplanes sp. SY1]|uniref:class I SAM-dependent methyltransferase n=1 Tax=Rhodoplanes sp. SY1 TaxID=3166646 RepID=UPI0038B57AF6